MPLLYWLPLSPYGLIWLSVPDIKFFSWYLVLSGYCLSPHSDIHCVFTAKLNILHHFFNILPVGSMQDVRNPDLRENTWCATSLDGKKKNIKDVISVIV